MRAILDHDLQESSVLWVHGRLPELAWIHFSKTLVSLNAEAFLGRFIDVFNKLCEGGKGRLVVIPLKEIGTLSESVGLLIKVSRPPKMTALGHGSADSDLPASTVDSDPTEDLLNTVLFVGFKTHISKSLCPQLVCKSSGDVFWLRALRR